MTASLSSVAMAQTQTSGANPKDALVANPELTVSRRVGLIRLVRQDCGSCHGMSLKGGLGPALTADRMQAFPRESLVAVILHGRPNTAMPGWKPILSEQEAVWIADQLQKGFPHE